MKICAGIVSYNPAMELLLDNINAILPQVDHVVIIDNGSKNVSDINELENFAPNLKVIYNHNNVGIAKALNQIGNEAKILGCDWFLTLDQDSICPSDIIYQYKCCVEQLNSDSIGMLCPYIKLRVLADEDGTQGEKYDVVNVAISSGSLVRAKAWESVGGFWDFLFIDKVDDDFCMSLREKGWCIIRVNNIILEHEIGHPKKHHLLFFSFYTDSYPDFRYYYIARNTVIVYKLHYNHNYSIFKIILIKVLKIILGEKSKLSKLSAFLNGIVDGYKLLRSGIVRNYCLLG